MSIMRSEQRSITLNIYLESSLLHEPDTQTVDHTESSAEKLTFYNVSHPEWAVHALKRTMYVQNVIDFGPAKDDSAQYGVTVVYQQERVSDVSKFTATVRMVIENAGVSITHL